MTFGTHQSFYLRDGWVFKLLDLFDKDPAIISDKEMAPIALGVGRNMVPAIRYWGLSSDLIEYERGTNKHKITSFGRMVKEHDIYLEKQETLWLIHSKMALNMAYTSTLYWLLNVNNNSIMNKSDFPSLIEPWIKSHATELKVSSGVISPNTLMKDINCIINLYTVKASTKAPDDNLSSPLAALDFIEDYKTGFRIKSVRAGVIPKEVFVFVLLNYIKEKRMIEGTHEVSVWELLNDTMSPGRILRLSSNALYELLFDKELRERDIVANVSRTAGMDVVEVNLKYSSLDSLLKRAIMGKE